MANEWYRKKTWTKEDENDFLIKLKRARNYSRPQYLIIQAHTLYDTNNDELLAIALNLVHKYFDVYPDDKFERSMAYGLMGHIYCRMKKYDTALENYKNAVDYERNIFPNCRTNAYLDYAELVIQLNRTELFENVETLLLEKIVAESILNKSKQNVFFQENFEKQQKLREALSRKEEKPLTPIEDARGKGLELF